MSLHSLVCLDPNFSAAAEAQLAEMARIQRFSPDTPIAELPADAVGLIVRLGVHLNAELLGHFPNLRVVMTATTGLDHIDQVYCEAHNITVLSLTNELAFLETIHATPEHTWGLLLALLRRIPHATQLAARGEWDRTQCYGNELYKKTIGIIGCGRVGSILGRYAKAFDMHVLVHDIRDIGERDFPYTATTLEKLLPQSDVVAIELPLTEATTQYFRAEHFALMRSNAVFINTARGAIVDEAALLEALQSGAIAGAAVDVLAAEHESGQVHASHPLVAYAAQHEHLLLTPHCAGSTYESMARTAEFMAEKLRLFLTGLT